MSGYLDLAKRASAEGSPETNREELASRRRRKLEEAGRRGLVVRWSEYPNWIALHDPTSGEWHEVRLRLLPLADGRGEPSAEENVSFAMKSRREAQIEAERQDDRGKRSWRSARKLKEEAEEAGMSERTVKSAEKRGGATYRESTAGEGRGAGRWMWEVHVCELDTAKGNVP